MHLQLPLQVWLLLLLLQVLPLPVLLLLPLLTLLLVSLPQAINKSAQIIETTYSKVDLDQLLGIGAFSLDKILAMEPDFLVS